MCFRFLTLFELKARNRCLSGAISVLLYQREVCMYTIVSLVVRYVSNSSTQSPRRASSLCVFSVWKAQVRQHMFLHSLNVFLSSVQKAAGKFQRGKVPTEYIKTKTHDGEMLTLTEICRANCRNRNGTMENRGFPILITVMEKISLVRCLKVMKCALCYYHICYKIQKYSKNKIYFSAQYFTYFATYKNINIHAVW